MSDVIGNFMFGVDSNNIVISPPILHPGAQMYALLIVSE